MCFNNTLHLTSFHLSGFYHGLPHSGSGFDWWDYDRIPWISPWLINLSRFEIRRFRSPRNSLNRDGFFFISDDDGNCRNSLY